MTRRRFLPALGIAALLAVASIRPAWSRQSSDPGGVREGPAARRHFTDVVLVDQDGRARRFYTDLLRDRVVVINTFYTSCSSSCPVVMGAMARIQAELGPLVGQEVHLLSLTVDPGTDTPGRLKAYAERLGARRGWYLLTGEAANVRLALRKLGQLETAPESHSNIVFVGNDRTGLWKKAFGLARPDDLVRLVRGVLADR
jgi:protein SCO1/2